MKKSTKASEETFRDDRRNRSDRLTVDLPDGVLTALKIHVARHQTTIRDVVSALVKKEIGQ